jgi:hypothetical protein
MRRRLNILTGLAILLSLLLPATALAANPPQCYAPLAPGAGVVDCSHKSDSYPADANGGQFLEDHCYILKDGGPFGFVYFADGPDNGCGRAPFTTSPVASGSGITSNNGECQPKGSFFGFPAWYKYLKGTTVAATDNTPAVCQPQISGLNDIWLIVAAVIEILLRLASLAAIAMIVWGGIQYITSQGEPDRTTKARNTIVNALIGLVIAVGAATFVSFVAGRFK